jgi:hypothetical protein
MARNKQATRNMARSVLAMFPIPNRRPQFGQAAARELTGWRHSGQVFI